MSQVSAAGIMTTLLTMTTLVTLKHCTSRNLNRVTLAPPTPNPLHSLKTLVERIYLTIKAFFLILSTLQPLINSDILFLSV